MSISAIHTHPGNGVPTRTPNGLLRQYFPKGTDLSGYTQAELDAVADELNNRPRQTLNWKKPTEVLNAFLVEAGGAFIT
jgi:transposase, IS30 family